MYMVEIQCLFTLCKDTGHPMPQLSLCLKKNLSNWLTAIMYILTLAHVDVMNGQLDLLV